MKCYLCKKDLSTDNFYKDKHRSSGHASACKECCSKRSTIYSRENKEATNERHRQSYIKNRDKILERAKKYRESKDISKYMQAAVKKSITKYPDRQKARYLARKLDKKSCIVCNDIKSHAHHDDYNKPLDVMWLCKKHHCQFHRSRNEAYRSFGYILPVN